MAKKILIAAAAVVVALVVINGTRLGSYMRLWKQQANTYLKNQIPPEQEIARLEMELKNLEGKDAQFVDLVARQAVKVENLSKEVAASEKKVKDRAQLVGALYAAARTGEGEHVTYNGKSEKRSELQSRARSLGKSLLIAEETVKSQKEELEAREKALLLNKKKLDEVRLIRQQMKTDLQRLRTALATERTLQAEEKGTIDDSGYLKVREEIKAVREKLEVMKKKRELLGEMREEISEEQREQDAKIDRYLESRFGNSKQ